MAQLRAAMQERQVHAAQTLVLLPYAQLIPQARQAWLRACEETARPACFLPRFETTMSWARSLGGFVPGPDDLQLDAARDCLTAASLLSRAGLGAHSGVLAARLMACAWSLARVAAAVVPAERAAWGARLGVMLAAALDSPLLALEAATARIALAWAASSSYATDPVFGAEPDLLVLLQGFQSEPLTQTLAQRLGTRVLLLTLDTPDDASEPALSFGTVALHAAQDAEDEAQRASACVLAHLAAGRVPVALVAQDRVLTRRVHAMLAQTGVTVSDETGWKLSTTRAAASLMSLLRALVWDASTDAVLDWLKHAPAFDAQQLTQAEIEWRRDGVREWRALPPEAALVQQAQALRERLQANRPLSGWLHDLRAVLQDAGQWPALEQDEAGQAVLDVLRLREGAELEFADVTARMAASELRAWVSQTLEGKSFVPGHGTNTQVLILPLSQLLGRPLAAVVLPGCDEARLPMSPEPPPWWTPAQSVVLGLPARDDLAAAARAAWDYALLFPHVDVLWRLSEGGEQLMASGFVQQLRLQQPQALAPDPRPLRALDPRPCAMPQPSGEALPVERLSGTAYEDLRRCPYRFFALRQLKLQGADELDVTLDKRDFGNWLHLVLRHFHQALRVAPVSEAQARQALLDTAAAQASTELGLSPAEFLPFAAAWPRVRAGYLQWLAAHQAGGAEFVAAEAWKEMPLGGLKLVGKIDRIDRLADGSALVIDYKTETPGITAQRVKTPLEDTQLAFYAALLSDDTLAAAYVNVGEKEGTRAYEQQDVVDLRDQLLDGIASDVTRIAAGALLPALGAGKACDFCDARGLCRKDFWTVS